SAENGCSFLSAKARGHRGVARVVGYAAAIRAGQWINMLVRVGGRRYPRLADQRAVPAHLGPDFGGRHLGQPWESFDIQHGLTRKGIEKIRSRLPRNSIPSRVSVKARCAVPRSAIGP